MSHLSLSDQDFENQFADTTLPPQLFSHEAHLRLAWIHIQKYGKEQAISNVCDQIKVFDQTHGDGTMFNRTVTVVAVEAVAHFIGKVKAADFPTFIAKAPRLKTNLKDLIKQHYSWDIFKDPAAKEVFLAPDLQPF
ncbi:MAG: hypothetical protein KTR30_33675 [Saprospiraceae bacterium]|nr:hypothetical protein [Saprospiraceae bacterium]